MPAELKFWALTVTPAENEDGSTQVVGVFRAPAIESVAFMRGQMMFVSVGSTASDVAARCFGGHWRDYPDAFLSVREADSDEEAAWWETEIERAREVSLDYPFIPEQFP